MAPLTFRSLAVGSPRFQAARTDTEAAAVVLDFASELEPEQLAAELEAIGDDRKDIAALAANAKAAADIIADHLRRSLGEGEAIQAPSGRMVYLGKVAAGNARLDPAAMVKAAAAGQLPDDCMPETTVKLPTLEKVRAAIKAGTIPAKVAATLIIVPPRVPGLRWRTLTDDGGDQ